MLLSFVRGSRLTRIIVYPAILFTVILTACSHIEPQRAHGDKALPGDKVWNFIHPWYDADWNLGIKVLYFIGPGHCPVCWTIQGSVHLVYLGITHHRAPYPYEIRQRRLEELMGPSATGAPTPAMRAASTPAIPVNPIPGTGAKVAQ